jgi:hypothetical protein
MVKTPTDKEIKNFIETFGTKGRGILEALERNMPEIDALVKTEIGWQMLKGDIDTLVSLVHKMLIGTATELEKSEATYLYATRIPNAAQKIKLWMEGMELIAATPKKQ